MLRPKLFLIIQFLFIAGLVSGQNSIPFTFLNNMVQPTPNAAALGKYVDYPVSYYTGVPNIGVPIYDLKDGALTMPISLSYHASGIRVSELATWVGLGWALNAGGIITRTVMGSPDEGTKKSIPGSNGPRGYYKHYGLSTLPILPYPLSTGQSSDPQNTTMGIVTNAISQGLLDTEPDLFTFNFNGYAGKFVFDENRNAVLLEDDNLKVKVVDSADNFTKWTITTPDGIQYNFGQNGIHETTVPTSTTSPPDLDSVLPSSWLLTSVINPNTKDTIKLSYATETYTYYDLGPETELFLANAPSQSVDLTHIHVNSLELSCDLSIVPRSYLKTTISGLRLVSIKSKNFTLKFIANTLRKDLSYTTNAYSLDSIKVYNNTNTCIKQFVLSHNYFVSTPNTNSYITQYLTNMASGDATDTKRLKLTSVAEISGDGLIQKSPYVFSYYETTQLPRRLSYDQDHWGFCNNWNGDHNLYFTPKVIAGICGTNISPGSRREAAFPAMEGFTLTSITDPLGAVTNFVYEGNTASNANPANSLVGGLRIKQITVTDNVTNKVQARSFNYNNSGQLFRMPVYLTTLYNEFYWANKMGLSGNNGFIGNSQAYTFFGILRSSQSVVPLQSPQGGHIGYSYVTETFGANGEGGYTNRIYKVIAIGTDSLSSRLNISAYTAYGYIMGAYGLYGNGQFNDIPPQNLTYNNGYNASNFYPLAPNQVDFQRGKLLSEVTYNASGDTLTKLTNIYNHVYHENALIRGIKCNISTTLNGQSSTNWYAFTYYKLHPGFSHLISTTKKTYSGNNILTQVGKYGYESPYHTLKTSDTTNDSQGNTLINKTYYSFDYSPSATTDNIFGKMKARNLLEPVRIDNFKNGNLVGERITSYHDFAASIPDTLIDPINIYNLETATPLTPAQAGIILNWNSWVSPLIPNSYLISKVGFYFDPTTGLMTNQQLTADKQQGIQWSKQLKMPVALVDNVTNNATLKEFYYEGFEESNANQLYKGNGHTGNNSIFAPYTVTWTLPNSRSYVICYWYFANGVWTFKPEQAFTGSLALNGGTAYDDIRIHPIDANMVTYTYDNNRNLTSIIDAKGLTSYYEYDSFLRLRNIRDYQKNIVKSICYNYSGQANGCFLNLPSFTNVAQSGTFIRNNCGSSATGNQVYYTVPAGIYTSNISAQDAYNQAQADITANGQTYANINGGCTINTSFYLSNTTNSGYQVNFSNSSNNITLNFQNNGSNTVQIPVGIYTVNVFPTGPYVNHTISLTGQTSVVAPRTTFTSVNISSGSGLTLSIK